MAKLPCRNDVFPFDAVGAIFVFTHFVAARLEVNDPFFALPVNFAAAIEITWRIGVHFDACGLGLRKTVDTVGQHRA
ncbi:hypothetical protein D3C85_1724510 [compost metagenome]